MAPNILLKTERDKRGWSQKEVADKMKAGEASYHRWESQGVLPTQYYRQELSRLFGKTIEELGLLPHQRSRPEKQHPVLTLPDPSSMGAPAPQESQEAQRALCCELEPWKETDGVKDLVKQLERTTALITA